VKSGLFFLYAIAFSTSRPHLSLTNGEPARKVFRPWFSLMSGRISHGAREIKLWRSAPTTPGLSITLLSSSMASTRWWAI